MNTKNYKKKKKSQGTFGLMGPTGWLLDCLSLCSAETACCALSPPMCPPDHRAALPEDSPCLLRTPGSINWPTLSSHLSSYPFNSPSSPLSLLFTLRIDLLLWACRVSSIFLQLIDKDWLIWPCSLQIPAWPLTAYVSYTIARINH